MRPHLFRSLDAVVLCLVAAGAGLAWVSGPGEQGSRATAYVAGKAVAWWPLANALRRDSVDGSLGQVVVEHGEGFVRIVRAPCPNHICIKQGKATHSHDQLVCVPSRLVIAIEGSGSDADEGLDAVH